MMKIKLLSVAVVCSLGFFQASGFAQLLDPTIMISEIMNRQSSPQATYNYNADEYLVVWEDYRNGACDIYGQFVNGDGTLNGLNFPVCNAEGNQLLPHLDFDPYNNQYVVVFKDQRNHDGENYYDIFGCLLTDNGEKIPVNHSEADSSFRISFNTGGPADWPSVSFNHIDKRYLVVFSVKQMTDMPPDVYGQLLKEDGNLLARSTLAKTSEGIDNFPIAEIPDFWEDVTDITYNYLINEWLVVYSNYISTGYITRVMAQRLNSLGTLLKQNGTEGYGPFDCSGVTGNGAPCTWPNVQANYEYPGIPVFSKTAGALPVCESLVAWRTYNMDGGADIYGQRIAYYTDQNAVNYGWKEGPAVDGQYFAVYYSTDAIPDDGTRSSFAISNTLRDQNHFDIGYSILDNEFMVGWGDCRNYASWPGMDLYCQLLKINEDDVLSLVDLTHNTTTSSYQNIPVAVNSDVFDGSDMYTGLAHGYQHNEFLLAYVHANDVGDGTTDDIYGRRVAGLAEAPIVGVDSQISTAPNAFELYGNYPNPFNPSTKIMFYVPKFDHVTVCVYDLIGKHIATLTDKSYAAGKHTISWLGLDANGQSVASGVYFYQVQVGDQLKSGKMTLLR